MKEKEVERSFGDFSELFSMTHHGRQGTHAVTANVAMSGFWGGIAVAEEDLGSWARISSADLVFAAVDQKVLESQIRAVFGYTQKLDELCTRVERIEGMVEAVLQKVAGINASKRSIIVPIQSLAPEPYELTHPLMAVVSGADDEGFEAALFDAGIFASGDTEEDAISDLKAALIDTYERLSELKAEQLGPGPTRQKQLLVLYIRKA